jgi:hypothetical protein
MPVIQFSHQAVWNEFFSIKPTYQSAILLFGLQKHANTRPEKYGVPFFNGLLGLVSSPFFILTATY